MNKTKVEWVKNPDGSQGYSWNPITGCLSSCEYCYARQLANGRLKNKYLANNLLPSQNEPNHEKHAADPFYPRFWPRKLKELHRARKARNGHHSDTISKGIFVCNMCEFFGDWVPASWQNEVLSLIKANLHHRFYFLSKQPWNVAKFSPFPENCWIGVTVCDKGMAFNAGRYYFNLVKAKVRFISFEPLLDDIMEMPIYSQNLIRQADWIIIGSQTKPYSPPKVEWVQSIVEDADRAGKPVFLKDNLKKLLGNDLRQDLPD